MTEEEAKKALFSLHFEYMKLPPLERKEKQAEYQEKRTQIKHALTRTRFEMKEKEKETKTK